MAEWFKAPVLKTGRGFTLPRGFESHPLRQTYEYLSDIAQFFCNCRSVPYQLPYHGSARSVCQLRCVTTACTALGPRTRRAPFTRAVIRNASAVAALPAILASAAAAASRAPGPRSEEM